MQAADTLVITRPDDWHLHVRDGAGLKSVVPHSARYFGRAIIMPNLVPPVTTAALVRNTPILSYSVKYATLVENIIKCIQNTNLPLNLQALEYKKRIEAAIPADSSFTPLMTIYLTDNTTPDDVAAAAAAGVVAFKLYPAGATTNSDSGVTDWRKCIPTLQAMEKVSGFLYFFSHLFKSIIVLKVSKCLFRECLCTSIRIHFHQAATRKLQQLLRLANAKTYKAVTSVPAYILI